MAVISLVKNFCRCKMCWFLPLIQQKWVDVSPRATTLAKTAGTVTQFHIKSTPEAF